MGLGFRLGWGSGWDWVGGRVGIGLWLGFGYKVCFRFLLLGRVLARIRLRNEFRV